MTARRPFFLTAAVVAILGSAAVGCESASPTEAEFDVSPAAPTDTSGFIPTPPPRIGG